MYTWCRWKLFGKEPYILRSCRNCAALVHGLHGVHHDTTASRWLEPPQLPGRRGFVFACRPSGHETRISVSDTSVVRRGEWHGGGAARMSGIIGHTMYAILGGKAAEHRRLPIASLIHRHYASYLCGAYLGGDVQTMPEAICVDTGEEVGWPTEPTSGRPCGTWVKLLAVSLNRSSIARPRCRHCQ